MNLVLSSSKLSHLQYLHIFSKEEVCFLLHSSHNVPFPAMRSSQHVFAAQHKQPQILLCQVEDNIKELQETKEDHRLF